MAFGSLLTNTPAPTVLNPFVAARPSSAGAAAAPAAQSTQSAASSAAAAPGAAASGAPARAASGGGHGGGGGGGASAAATLLETATDYTTTVAGKQYSGSVVESGGTYTASVPSLPGATATGATAQAAENNLDTRIDELV